MMIILVWKWISVSQNLRVFGPGLNPLAPLPANSNSNSSSTFAASPTTLIQPSAIMPREQHQEFGGVVLPRNARQRSYSSSSAVVDMDDRGWTSLHVVAKKGDLIKVKQLLDEGVDVNVCAWGPKSQGVTPLHLAAQGGHLKVMDELLERGANIDARTKGACGWTPLHKAAKERKRNAIKFLVENGAFLPDDINDGRFNPPLHYCPGLEWAYEEMKRLQDDTLSAGESSSSGN